MSFLQPLMLLAIPLIVIPIVIHLINQWRYQTKRWGAMMFLLAANRMNRGYARLRQWLILAMRTIVIAGLIIAASRPLASGLLGLAAGGKVDATLVLLDRSPSMQQESASGQTKLDTGRKQLSSALGTLGSSQWVLIDSSSRELQTFSSVDALVDSPATHGSSATASVPHMLQAAVDYLTTNKPGRSDLWICSDLRASDWLPESSHWPALRKALQELPQSPNIHLVAYPDPADANLSIRVTEVRRDSSSEGDALLISLNLSHTGTVAPPANLSLPVQVEIDGARSELNVELTGRDVQLRQHRVPLAQRQQRGWGRVTIPDDQNNSDNVYYFAYDDAQVRRVVLVSDDRQATRALEIAASIAPDGQANTQVDVVAPEQLDSSLLDGAALLIWQSVLPQGDLAAAVDHFVSRGGQVLFFPPEAVFSSGHNQTTSAFLGVAWSGWHAASAAQDNFAVENWRSDQDLLAATRSGAGLPVGQLEVQGYATLSGEVSALATFQDGRPLLARIATSKGGVYFCSASPSAQASTLATNGVVLYAAIQRAIEQGVIALGNSSQRVAGTVEEPTTDWRPLAQSHKHVSFSTADTNSAPTSSVPLANNSSDATNDGAPLSSEYAWQCGAYESNGRYFAINRAPAEDQTDLLDDNRLNQLFAGLKFSRVDDRAGSLSGIVREIWQLFLLAMIAAMLLEAALCLPRKSQISSANITKTSTVS